MMKRAHPPFWEVRPLFFPCIFHIRSYIMKNHNKKELYARR